MTTDIDKDAFMNWLRELGDQPCGTQDRCPLALFQGGASSMDLFMDLDPNGWAESFAKWADEAEHKDNGHPCAWHLLSARKALAYLTKGTAVLLLALSFSLPAHAWPHSGGGSHGWKPRSAAVHAPRPHAPRPRVPKPSRPRKPRAR